MTRHAKPTSKFMQSLKNAAKAKEATTKNIAPTQANTVSIDPSKFKTIVCDGKFQGEECGYTIFNKGAVLKEMDDFIFGGKQGDMKMRQIEILYCAKCGKFAPGYEKMYNTLVTTIVTNPTPASSENKTEANSETEVNSEESKIIKIDIDASSNK